MKEEITFIRNKNKINTQRRVNNQTVERERERETEIYTDRN